MEILITSFVLFFLIGATIILLPKYARYNFSNYGAISGNSFFKTIFNTGNYGEFLTFLSLEKLKGHYHLMTNLYIPKKDGSTTEIDLIMLSQTGIYVFESKNYSGWIFGDEKSKNWMQTFPSKQKNRFFNPIWQNKGHINALKSSIELDNDTLFKSYIVFSKRCTLKKVNVTSENVKVIKRNALIRTIKKDIKTSINMLEIAEVDQLYSDLQKYIGVDEAVKKAHIENVQIKKF
ncbi:nuclease-related domain-containing protein [Virgibacillus sp. DJP39]|uniref:nuclease-related domain-containing protein n=1 Tax=Virgibacillus sp. DJP39 TaxID=3409790 RepID=UPI003BB50742